eukprot:14926476-Alexandrium_andersonii.AAC.1
MQLETSTEPEFVEVRHSSVSITTYQGVELSIGELPTLRTEHMYHGQLLRVEHDTEASDGSEPQFVAADIGKQFPYTLVVVGMLHVLHNLTEEVCRNLSCWDWFIDLLRPLFAFLHS